MKEFLYDALATKLGIILRSDDPVRLRARLYKLRGAEPEFADLSFIISPVKPDTDLWIIKRVDNEKV